MSAKAPLSKPVNQKVMDDDNNSFLLDRSSFDGGDFDKPQHPRDFRENFKEKPMENFETFMNASDYRAGQPNMGDKLSFCGRSANKSGKSAKRNKIGILDAYGRMSVKS